MMSVNEDTFQVRRQRRRYLLIELSVVRDQVSGVRGRPLATADTVWRNLTTRLSYFESGKL